MTLYYGDLDLVSNRVLIVSCATRKLGSFRGLNGARDRFEGTWMKDAGNRYLDELKRMQLPP